MNILSLKGVSKQYQNYMAVDNLSFDVPSGSIFGMLGPNGAGKTSTIRIITGITGADSGTIYFDGEKWKRSFIQQIGYMPEERGLYKKMKVAEHLEYLAQLRGMSKGDAQREIKMWFEKFDIKDWWSKKIEELSKGMQQKVQFIATVVHKPKLLILDEPFSGLDPINSNLLKDEISELKKSGTTIIFSTHRMEQVEEICDQIVLINKGKVILNGGVREIKEENKKNLFSVSLDKNSPLPTFNGVEVLEHNNEEYKLKLDGSISTNDLLKELIQRGLVIKSFHEILPTLNDIFIDKVEQNIYEINLKNG